MLEALNIKKIYTTTNDLLLMTILLLLMIKQIYSYMNVQWVNNPGSRVFQAIGTTNYLTVALSLVALFCIIILAHRIYYKNIIIFSNLFKLNLLIITLTIIGWTIITFVEVGVKNTFYISTNPLVYITVLAFMIGLDNSLWGRFVQLAPKLAIISIALSFYYYLSFTSIYDGGILGGNTPVTTYFVTGFWLTAASIVGVNDENKLNLSILLVLIVMLMVLSVVIYSRGWMIQSIILLLVTSFRIVNRQRVLRLLKTLIILTVIGSIAYYIIENYYTDSLISLIAKFGRDTRSFQYAEIFDQTPWYQFIIGGGVNVRYYSHVFGEYAYIDNQFIFTAFRFGILMLLPYVYFFITPVWVLRKKKMDFKKKCGVYIIIMWLLALGGLSVYNVIIVDIKSIVLPVIAGRCFYLAKLIEPRRSTLSQ
jgi:hypothetical protein